MELGTKRAIEELTDRLKTLEDNLDSLGDTVNDVIRKIKTLEDKVEFIMKNGTMAKLVNRMFINTRLQNLWDEQNEGKNILSERELAILDKTFGEPPVKECEHHFCLSNHNRCCKCDKVFGEPTPLTKPSVKADKIGEIISDFDNNFYEDMFRYPLYRESVKSWLRDKLKDL